ncbi:hypothetical protein EVAR_9947_1 [Eumeta japonica]|uniref:Uncharacterized protein n=1 Tax=Eumeta variegata TaxID=151549 RepID=A0A4C1TQV8_EUMVA|nr:hypothetical protein EVAR_9947_1 [Eumeta japonica]
MVSLDIEGGLRQHLVADHKKPAVCPQMPGKPLRYGDGLPERLGGCGLLRRRAVQKVDFEGLYSGLDSWSNFLESRPGLLTLRTRGPRRIRAGIRGRRGPYVFRTVGLSTGGRGSPGTIPCEELGRSK